MRLFFSLYHLLIISLLLSISANVSAAPAGGPGDWLLMGTTNSDVAPYNLYYYKVAKINGDAHRYATNIEVDIQGDANSFYMQGRYNIRINKYAGTTGRFDGLEIRFVSGNPLVATFYVFNDALWVKSNYPWSSILSYY